MAKLKKETRITREKERLYSLFFDCDREKLELVRSLINQAAFMLITLEDLSEEIDKNGMIEAYQHGEKQSGMKTSAALQAFNSTMKNYSIVMKQLVAVFPDKKRSNVKQPNSLVKLFMEAKSKNKEETEAINE